MANVITNKGREVFTNRLNGGGTVPNFVHWGLNNPAVVAAITQTALASPSSEARVQGNVTRVSSGTGGMLELDIFRVTGTLIVDANKIIGEVGLFDASTAGNMVARADFPGISLNAGDGVQWSLDVRFS
jgi:hypothetical protein